MPKLPEGGHQPTPEEMQEAKEMVSPEQKIVSDDRVEGYSVAKNESEGSPSLEWKHQKAADISDLEDFVNKSNQELRSEEKKWRLPTVAELREAGENGKIVFPSEPTYVWVTEQYFGAYMVDVMSDFRKVGLTRSKTEYSSYGATAKPYGLLYLVREL